MHTSASTFDRKTKYVTDIDLGEHSDSLSATGIGTLIYVHGIIITQVQQSVDFATPAFLLVNLALCLKHMHTG